MACRAEAAAEEVADDRTVASTEEPPLGPPRSALLCTYMERIQSHSKDVADKKLLAPAPVPGRVM